MKLGLFQNIRVKGCHTVYGKAVMNIQVCHMHSVIAVDNDYLFIIEFTANFIIKYLNDRNELRHNLIQIGNRPLFQCFCQNRMIRIGTGL